KRRNKAIEKCRFFNLRPEDYYVVQVLDFKLKFSQERKEEQLLDSLRDNGNTVVMIIEEIMDYLNLKGIASTKLNGVYVLLSFNEEREIKKKLDKFNEYVINSLDNKLRNMYVKIGIGR